MLYAALFITQDENLVKKSSHKGYQDTYLATATICRGLLLKFPNGNFESAYLSTLYNTTINFTMAKQLLKYEEEETKTKTDIRDVKVILINRLEVSMVTQINEQPGCIMRVYHEQSLYKDFSRRRKRNVV